MTPERAFSFGVTADICTIETTVGRFGDAWVIFARPLGDRPFTQSQDVFTLCEFVARLRELEDA